MAQLMPAIVFKGVGEWELRQVSVPRLRSAEDVLVAVEAVGICGSDLQALSVPPKQPATPGAVLGHEFVGTVVEVGSSVRHLSPGDRVVADPEVKCGRCRCCQRGMPNLCTALGSYGHDFDGALAPSTVMPGSNFYVVPPDLPADVAVFVEPLACVLNGFRRLAVSIEDRCVVMGCGPIGLLLAMLLRASGVRQLICVDPLQGRRQKAKEIGADVTLDPSVDPVVEAVISTTGGVGPDVVVDSVGSLLPEAVTMAAPSARILLIGLNSEARGQVRQCAITQKDLHIHGSFITRFTVPAAIDILATNKIDVRPLVTYRVSLAGFGDALAALRDGSALKAIVYPRSKGCREG